MAIRMRRIRVKTPRVRKFKSKLTLRSNGQDLFLNHSRRKERPVRIF